MTENMENNEIETEAPPKREFRWGQVAAWVLVIGLLTVVAIQLRKAQEGTMSVGQPAPEFTVTTFEGVDITPEDMRGKVVLLNVWASWCKPCEAEAAELQQAWEMYEAERDDVLFIGIAYVDTDQGAASYIEKFGITYPNGHDFGTEVTQALRSTGVPETFVIDKEGNLAFVKIGPFNSLSEIIQAVDKVLE